MVEIGVIFAGLTTAQALGDLGAEVIKVESVSMVPETVLPRHAHREPRLLWADGFVEKNGGEHPWHRRAGFNSRQRNKRRVTMELTTPRGKEMFKQLIKVSDVFVENNGTDLMEKLGLTYDILSDVNPGLIMVRMPAWGNSGPYAR